jgi:DNA repair exonuclease SbcCD ATPase subunit
MKSLCSGGLFLVAALAVCVLPSPSAAAVRIELKNGGTIIADECRESDGKLLCYKMGGTFELEKQDISSVQKTTAEEGIEEQGVSAPEEPEATSASKTDKSAEHPASEAEKRLEQITQRKRALQPEREKLIRDREHLQDEVKKAPDWMTTDRFAALKKKISTLDERIKDFNDEVQKLNQEEKTIRDSIKTTGPKVP